MLQREIDILRGKLIPQVKKVDFVEGVCWLQDGVRMEVPSGTGELARSLAAEYWGITPAIAERAPQTQGEAYSITIEADIVRIAGHIRYAMQTLRQLAEPERGVGRFSRYLLQQGQIEDSPTLQFRGVHLCCFPETQLWELEKQIRLAAYYKFNYVVIEPWATFPYETHPELAWREMSIPRAEWKRLIELAYDLGVQPIPQLNLFGHATGSRVSSGKHAVLDFSPELQALFEPDGWTWCLSNPVTIALQEDVVRELHDFFCKPPFFHIGYDEAYSFATCASCRSRNLEELVGEHIRHFHALLSTLGSRTIMWHDMLFQQEDPRWKNCVAFGKASDGLADLALSLPKDILIADWQYHNPADLPEAEKWATARFMKDAGFEILVCPWHNIRGTYSLGQFAARESLRGMLATTWHENYSHKLHDIFYGAGQAGWTGATDAPCVPGAIINYHLRQIGWDMKLSEYEQTGASKLQISRAPFPT